MNNPLSRFSIIEREDSDQVVAVGGAVHGRHAQHEAAGAVLLRPRLAGEILASLVVRERVPGSSFESKIWARESALTKPKVVRSPGGCPSQVPETMLTSAGRPCVPKRASGARRTAPVPASGSPERLMTTGPLHTPGCGAVGCFDRTARRLTALFRESVHADHADVVVLCGDDAEVEATVAGDHARGEHRNDGFDAQGEHPPKGQ